MVAVIREFISDIGKDQDTAGDAERKSENIDH